MPGRLAFPHRKPTGKSEAGFGRSSATPLRSFRVIRQHARNQMGRYRRGPPGNRSRMVPLLHLRPLPHRHELSPGCIVRIATPSLGPTGTLARDFRGDRRVPGPCCDDCLVAHPPRVQPTPVEDAQLRQAAQRQSDRLDALAARVCRGRVIGRAPFLKFARNGASPVQCDTQGRLDGPRPEGVSLAARRGDRYSGLRPV